MSLEKAIANIGKRYRAYYSSITWSSRGTVEGREITVELDNAVWPSGSNFYLWVHVRGGCDGEPICNYEKDNCRMAFAMYRALIKKYNLTEHYTSVSWPIESGKNTQYFKPHSSKELT